MSMNLNAYNLVDNTYRFVFPDSWTTEESYPEGFDWTQYINDVDYDLHPIKNLSYRPELDLSMSNTNMVYIMRDVLGLACDSSDGFILEVDTFLAVTQIWLQKHLGKVTPALEGYEYKREMRRPVKDNVLALHKEPVGCRAFEGGRQEGYDEHVVRRMVTIAQEGKKCGATHIGAA